MHMNGTAPSHDHGVGWGGSLGATELRRATPTGRRRATPSHAGRDAEPRRAESDAQPRRAALCHAAATPRVTPSHAESAMPSDAVPRRAVLSHAERGAWCGTSFVSSARSARVRQKRDPTRAHPTPAQPSPVHLTVLHPIPSHPTSPHPTPPHLGSRSWAHGPGLTVLG